MAFDGKGTITSIEYNKQSLEFGLDTGGAGPLSLWPTFLSLAGDLTKGKVSEFDLHGIGGSRKVKYARLSNLMMRIGGSDCLQKAPMILLEPPNQDRMFYYGVLGLETLMDTRETVLDFGAMRLTLNCLHH